MPKVARELGDAVVRKLSHGEVQGIGNTDKKPGTPCPSYHAVGGVAGLLLCCKPSGSRSWILRTKVGEVRRDIGLGGYPDVTLSQARHRARDIKDKIRQRIDPVAERKALRSALMAGQAKAVTFRQVAVRYITKKGKEFKTAKQVQKLTSHLETYAHPYIGNMVVADIERAHIVKMLEPIWETKTETATRVRANVERILDMAGAEGLRTGDNPARWKGNLDLTFPLRSKVSKVAHYNALPVDELPAFWRDLKTQDSVGAKALQFAILTAARPGEARGATWEEINLRKKLWAIPGERMKNGKPHNVPLAAEAIALLNSLPRLSGYLFSGPRGKPISDVAMSKAPKLIGRDVTAHGFRATFRTWVQENTSYPEEVAELALAHVNSDATRVAYARSELIDKRRDLMADWEHFIFKGRRKRGKVVSMRRRA